MFQPGGTSRHQQGFTLIEVLVALSILALSLGVLYQSFGWTLRRTAALSHEEAAWLAAQSLLAEVRAQPLFESGTTEGEGPHGLHWQTRIERQLGAVSPKSPMQPFAVTVEVRWGARESQRVRLQSLEIGRVRT